MRDGCQGLNILRDPSMCLSKLFILNLLVGERGFEPPTPYRVILADVPQPICF